VRRVDSREEKFRLRERVAQERPAEAEPDEPKAPPRREPPEKPSDPSGPTAKTAELKRPAAVNTDGAAGNANSTGESQSAAAEGKESAVDTGGLATAEATAETVPEVASESPAEVETPAA